MSTWNSTHTIAQAGARLRDARSITVITHMKPDGDAVGSSLALVRALNLTGTPGLPPRAEAWYAGPFPPWMSDIVGSTPHRKFEGANQPPRHADPEVVVVVDTGSWSQLEPFADFLRGRSAETIIIDHHKQGDPEIADWRVLDTSAAAVCLPIAELCRELLRLPGVDALPEAVATPLFLGTATDTGWFKHSNVGPAVMRTAGDLLAAGAKNTWLFQMIEQRDSLGRLRLLSRALASLELADDGRLGIMTLTKSDFEETGAAPGESGGFVDFPALMPNVRVVALLTEASDWEKPDEGGDAAEAKKRTITKISFRSKEGAKAVDVNLAARQFGGGGHLRAAGARAAAGIDETKRRVIEVIREQTGTW
ncbi:MAG: DHH family phosphoesterase [Phycisphaerales bacterium]